MFYDHLDLKKLYIYIFILKKYILFTKLIYFDHLNKIFEHFYLRLMRI